MSIAALWHVAPVLAAVEAVVTLAVCQILARKNGHIPSYMSIPTISLISNQGVERYIFLAGILLFAYISGASLIPFTRFLLSRVERPFSGAAKATFVSGCAALCGLAAFAAVPMQSNAAKLLENGDAVTGSNMTLWSQLHEAAAAVFFVASWLFMSLHLYLFRASPRLAVYASPCWWRLKLSLLVLPAFVLIASVFARTRATTQDNYAGLTQWVLVLCCVLFYGCMAKDFKAFNDVATRATSHVELDGAIEMQVAARPIIDDEGPSAANAFDADPLTSIPLHEDEEKASLL